MNKKRSGALIFFNALLVVMYVPLLYLILAEFKFIPWYASDASFILYYLLWLPLCGLSIITVVTGFFTSAVGKTDTMLVCYNALVIPLLFLLDFIDSVGFGYVIAAFSVFTVIGFIIRYVRSLIKK
ncbi:MAG: hypothetical protein IJC50_07500 [Clostridia bacterium]|nr:hypothetical protein [Clostridia bacterium]